MSEAAPAGTPAPACSIVVPVFNETHRLAGTLPQFVDFVQRAAVSTELIVVDDGSDDDTAAQAETFVPAQVGRTLRAPHRGKGGAVRAGSSPRADGTASSWTSTWRRRSSSWRRVWPVSTPAPTS